MWACTSCTGPEAKHCERHVEVRDNLAWQIVFRCCREAPERKNPGCIRIYLQIVRSVCCKLGDFLVDILWHYFKFKTQTEESMQAMLCTIHACFDLVMTCVPSSSLNTSYWGLAISIRRNKYQNTAADTKVAADTKEKKQGPMLERDFTVFPIQDRGQNVNHEIPNIRAGVCACSFALGLGLGLGGPSRVNDDWAAAWHTLTELHTASDRPKPRSSESRRHRDQSSISLRPLPGPQPTGPGRI